MLNQLILVGRLANELEMKDGKCEITLAVPRSYKNEKGEYETDFINIVLSGNIAENTKEYCTKGDVIGIKGKIESETMNDGTYTNKLVAEKVTFISSHKGDEE